MNDQWPPVKSNAIEALCKYKPKEAIKPVAQQLAEHADARRRRQVSQGRRPGCRGRRIGVRRRQRSLGASRTFARFSRPSEPRNLFRRWRRPSPTRTGWSTATPERRSPRSRHGRTSTRQSDIRSQQGGLVHESGICHEDAPPSCADRVGSRFAQYGEPAGYVRRRSTCRRCVCCQAGRIGEAGDPGEDRRPIRSRFRSLPLLRLETGLSLHVPA